MNQKVLKKILLNKEEINRFSKSLETFVDGYHTYPFEEYETTQDFVDRVQKFTKLKATNIIEVQYNRDLSECIVQYK